MAEEMSFDIKGFVNAFHISRAKIFSEIKANRLQTFKIGRRTLISKQAAETWMREAEEVTRRTRESDELARRTENPRA